MSLLNKYNKLKKQADILLNKHENECTKMFEMIEHLLDYSAKVEGQYVFRQIGDGYVLVTNKKLLPPLNTPLISILEYYEKYEELIDFDTLHNLSI